MANAHDVAAYILQRMGEMTTWKLQKLVYYAQAWHLAWTGQTLFPERIEAWANGPVIRDLYREHRGEFRRHSWEVGDPARLSAEERANVDAVLHFYGDKSGQWLSDLTHAEEPWRHAREGLAPSERGNREIEPAVMAGYYGALAAANS